MNIARTLNLNAGLGRAAAVILAAGLFCGAMSYADNPPVPSKHQMMKDCMAKQKASEAGRSREDMRNSCKDVTKTEKQNADKASSTTQEANRG